VLEAVAPFERGRDKKGGQNFFSTGSRKKLGLNLGEAEKRLPSNP